MRNAFRIFKRVDLFLTVTNSYYAIRMIDAKRMLISIFFCVFLWKKYCKPKQQQQKEEKNTQKKGKSIQSNILNENK